MSRGVIESAALEAMARGWAVFPVKGKKPLKNTHGFKDASTEARLAGIWFERHPDRGLAVATGTPSDVWVLDLDSQEAIVRIAGLQEEHGAFPKTVTTKTHNGFHIFFRMPDDEHIGIGQDVIGKGVDLRGTGGYAVIPPSPHPDGGHYGWAPGRSPEEIAIAHAPQWLVDMVKSRPVERGEMTDTGDELVDALLLGWVPNQRHEVALGFGGWAAKSSLPRERAIGIIEEVSSKAGDEEIDDRVTAVTTSFDRVKAGAQVAGYRTLETILPEHALEAFQRFGIARSNGCEDDKIDGAALPQAVSALEAQPPELPAFAITGFLLDREIHLLVSDGGVGKTTLALAIAAAMSGGYDLFGCPTFKVNAPGSVLVLSEEDGLGVLQNRIEAIVRGHGWDGERVLSNVYLIAQEGASLDDLGWRAHILSEVKRTGARLVVLDPWAELTLAEENSNKETKPLVRFLRKITAKAGAAVLVLHHAGKPQDGKRKIDRIRGATALTAAARGIWFLESLEIGIAVECLKMSRSEKPRAFVVKRKIESDPENRTIWDTARLTYASQTDAEDQIAEQFVLDQLTRRDTLNTTELKALAKGTGVSGVGVSGALRDLSAIGKIGYEKGPNNSKRWHFLPVAQESRQPRQPDLPDLPEVAGQVEEAAPVVAPTRGRATGAGAGGQSGKAIADTDGIDASQSSLLDTLIPETVTDVSRDKDDAWTP